MWLAVSVKTAADFIKAGSVALGVGADLVDLKALREPGGAAVITERAKDYHRLLSIFEPKAVLTDNIWGYLWGKLGYGALLFVTALTNASMSENLASEKHFPVFRRVGQEVMAVAKARGVSPLGFNGFDPLPTVLVR